jgi:hypothetical protein
VQFDKHRIIQSIMKALANRGMSDTALHDAGFHMTDWLEDLEELYTYYRDPESVPTEKAEQLLAGFLLHVPNHVAAAAKLVADFPVSDIFGVGAVEMAHDEKVKQLRVRLNTWGDDGPAPPMFFPSNQQIAECLQNLDGAQWYGASIGLTEDFELSVDCKGPREVEALTWRSGPGENEYECITPDIQLTVVINAFQQFAKGDHSWKKDLDWKERGSR